ncbi:MAG: oxidoreductase, partial [Delftia sp.]|nr:oxidoreductase [Delftia sp.]
MTQSSNANGKPKLAFYRAAGCGGCEITLTALRVEIVDLADVVFWPYLADYKSGDVEALGDGEIDVCLFNGAIRDSENERIARLLRSKSRLMVAFGACAHQGGIPGLANLYGLEAILERTYDSAPALDDLPTLYEQVRTLAQTVDVDYYVPGCPPVTEQARNVFQVLLNGERPAQGSVIGADGKTNCDTCPRQKGSSGMRVQEFKRPHLVRADPELCFLAQGLLCSGPATRAGCGLPCVMANAPCRGCYGPADGVDDQGAKLLGAIAALIDADELK